MNKINYIQVTEEEYRKALEEGKNLRKSEDLCEHLNKLLGKKCYRYSEMLDLGLIFTDNILSRDYGRTIVDPYKEGGAQYIEYIEALREYVSGREDYESSVYMLDNYNMIQVYDDYSSHYYTNDGVHLNGYGRYLTGVNIARWLENLR